MKRVTRLGAGFTFCSLLAAIALSAPISHAAPLSRTCGLLPGEGAYSYIKTRGVTCRTGRRVAFRARRRFCAQHNSCRLGPPFPISKQYRGQVGYRGWSCRVTQGWELSVVSCQSGDRQIFEKSAA